MECVVVKHAIMERISCIMSGTILTVPLSGEADVIASKRTKLNAYIKKLVANYYEIMDIYKQSV